MFLKFVLLRNCLIGVINIELYFLFNQFVQTVLFFLYLYEICTQSVVLNVMK